MATAAVLFSGGLDSAVLAAKEMGGSLTAQSEGSGKGATFTVLLPVSNSGTASSLL